MYKKGFLSFSFLILVLISKSQNIDSTTLSKLKLNFAVPDMPAFKTLGTDPSNLLRPSTVQALAISLSSFNDNGKLIIPKAFAMEVAPSLLINGNKNKSLSQLEAYSKNASLNSFRVSFGTSTDSASLSRNFALGFRISLIDKGDPTYDLEFQKKIVEKLKTIRNSNNYEEAKNSFAKKIKNLDPKKIDIDSLINANNKEFSLYFQGREDIQKPFIDEVKAAKEEYRKEHWNDDKLDLALAFLSSSKDSILKNTKFNKINLWSAYAIKAGKNGQLIVGLNGEVYKNLFDTSKETRNKIYSGVSIPIRYLVGTNRIKGFGEVQLSYTGLDDKSSVLFNLGTEINLIDGIWLNYSAGLDYDSVTKNSALTSKINLKFTLPENYKFF